MKFLFRERVQKGFPDEALLAATQTKGVVRKKDYGTRTVTASKDLHLLKLVETGDFVISLRSFQGGIEIAHCRGIISPAYTVLEPRRETSQSYYSRFFKSPDFINGLTLFVTGIREGQNIDYERLSRAYMPLPPMKEQVSIGRFIDWSNGRLQRAIHAKRKVIALLNEQKQAIIQRAITRGFVEHLPLNILRLPKEVRTKSGWQSFSVRRLIQLGLLTIQDGNHGELHPKASDYVDDGIPFLMANNVRPEGLDLTGCAKLREDQARALRIGFAHSGDVLLTHKATIGQIGFVPKGLKTPFVMLTPQVTYYRTAGSKILGEYLFFYMQSPLFQEQLKILSLNQSTRPYVGLIEQKNLIVCFPSVDIQRQICAEILDSVAPVEAARSRVEREVDLLNEYRTRLVADVVTGQLDVSAAAALLPEEGPLEGELLYNADNLDEAEVVDEEVVA